MHHDPFSLRRDDVARLRFSIISSLLVCPPRPRELSSRLDELAAKIWHHPANGASIQFSRSTIERWYYIALRAPTDPLGALRHRIRADRGHSRRVGPILAERIRVLHRAHPGFSYALFFDNLEASLRAEPIDDPLPSASTVRRWMQSQGLFKQRRRGPKRPTPGSIAATERFEQREVRSYEVEHVHALWHLDFHVGSRRVLLRSGTFAKAYLLGILDDHSRLCCHAQWYLSESAETLVHGLVQAILKRGIPRSLLYDNGPAMLAAETVEGLDFIGIDAKSTLNYSPYQNGKQESFWNNIEGRLLPMIAPAADIGLDELNELTQAWVESDYNRREHSELGTSPLARSLTSRSVVRPSPSAEFLRAAFRQTVLRHQRRSDGTILLEGRRFEIPSRFRHVRELRVKYARWDLASVDLWDVVQRMSLGRILPLDKAANADGVRRLRGPIARPMVDPKAPRSTAPSSDEQDATPDSSAPSWRVEPFLHELMAEMRSSGLPPGYLPFPEPAAPVGEEGRNGEEGAAR
jgi:putative transposase